MSLTSAEKKRLQRQRDKATGWVEVTVKVASDRVDELRRFASSLPPPNPPVDPDQLDMIDQINASLSSQTCN
jgi:hypothetical protein